jgi:aspartokinase/homoserine dehydrogenase 1
VGGQLLIQINKQQNFLMEKHQLKLKVAGILNINGMIFNENGIDLDKYDQTIEKQGEKADIHAYVDRIISLNLRNSVFIDCTASSDIAEKYFQLLNSFVFVVAANKIANSSEYSLYRKLKETALARGVKFLYETNVGAGLPIINTINDLTMSGDRILKIEAVLSGTLNFIFNTISENISLSKAIMMAKEKGYSEPDPRIDLSGTDVVRKLLILSREAGYAFEKTDVQLVNFLPKECFDGTLDHFWESVQKFDAAFEVRRKEVVARGEKWRFVATLDNGNPSVQLMTVDSKHPAFNLEGSNNIIIITTERYKELPMVIKGYGAGGEVTAAGLFADIIRCANN